MIAAADRDYLETNQQQHGRRNREKLKNISRASILHRRVVAGDRPSERSTKELDRGMGAFLCYCCGSLRMMLIMVEWNLPGV